MSQHRPVQTGNEMGAAAETDHELGRQRTGPLPISWSVLVMVATGGALGALARWGVQHAWAAGNPSGVPYPTLITNILGGLLIGILMVLVTDVWKGCRLIRPFLGAGVLGGFTTFSTYVLEVQQLVTAEASGRALGYLVGTVGAVLLATALGVWSTRLATRTIRPVANGAES